MPTAARDSAIFARTQNRLMLPARWARVRVLQKWWKTVNKSELEAICAATALPRVLGCWKWYFESRPVAGRLLRSASGGENAGGRWAKSYETLLKKTLKWCWRLPTIRT
ncbi:hypothetical protein KCP75_21855 [Salmonella enterica subsp. enterica]|nr:hypothetical protein KCP75_21855 [Salmonella enterica subsp. enterica]